MTIASNNFKFYMIFNNTCYIHSNSTALNDFKFTFFTISDMLHGFKPNSNLPYCEQCGVKNEESNYNAKTYYCELRTRPKAQDPSFRSSKRINFLGKWII